MTHLLDGTDEDRPALAAGLMLTALALLAVQDALARMTGSEMSFWQFQLLRASGNTVLLIAFALTAMGGLPRRPNNALAVGGRVLMMIMATLLFFGGIPHVTIVEMAAGLYTYPIFVTILSALVLREAVGIRRITAVVIGALGAGLILQPGAEDFQWIKLMPIGCGFFYGMAIIITRRFCRGENAVTMSMSQSIAFVVIGAIGCVYLAYNPLSAAARETLPFLANGWLDAALWAFAATLVCSVFNAAGNVMLIKAYQSAESSWLAPFDYSYLIFASIAGVVFFATVPGQSQIMGMALIAGSGAFTAWRERRLKADLAADLGTKLPPPGTRL